MAFQHSLDTLEALDLARSIARLNGGAGYLDVQAKSIQEGLLARPKLPALIHSGSGRQRKRHDLKRVEIKPFQKRSLPAKQREIMKRDYPDAYNRTVVETPPERAYSVRLDPAKAGRASAEWNGYKAEGVAEWAAELGKRFGNRDWTVGQVQAETLYAIRQLKRGEEAKADKLKIELMEFVIAKELPLLIPGMSDGKLVLRENGPSYSVDYDLLEAEFKAAATLINRSNVKGSTRVEFIEWFATEEDPDDSDDSGMSRAYLARMRGGLNV